MFRAGVLGSKVCVFDGVGFLRKNVGTMGYRMFLQSIMLTFVDGP